MIYDVAIIGAGVVGSLIARELSRYHLRICLLEKASDVAMGTTKSNSAIIHAGFDAAHGSLKAQLNVKGNAMMTQLTAELGVPFKRIGSLVVGFDDADETKLQELYDNGIRNGVPKLEMLSQEQVRTLEPSISLQVTSALYAPTAGIICPYELTIAAAECAVANGVTLQLEQEITDISRENGFFTLSTKTDAFHAHYVVNAAGVYADQIAQMVESRCFAIKPRKGEYMLLDKDQASLAKTVIFQTPTAMGKGILVTPTVDGNLLLGPTSVDIDDQDDVSTTADGLTTVAKIALKSIPSINIRKVITSFAGIRACSTVHDFIIEESREAKGFMHVAGIESPGLSASPAIALMVTDLLADAGLVLSPKSDFNPIRKPLRKFFELDCETQNKLITANPRYGNVICRCEHVTEAEIVESIHRPAGARNVDAVKRRTRCGMGRCQGGFCTPRITEILARELQVPMDKITKKGGNSWLLAGRTK